ncbi:hypothetical protein NHQ30_005363 [Ciborinia camelliae]|nr:hypothetical protein NHQ30_005363 [Ciborinia camelliae]
MSLLSLPAELVDRILLQAVLTRGIKRGLRLRLVNKWFSQNVQSALFESRLLDSFDTGATGILCDWHIEKDHGKSKLWHSYLVHRVLNETSLSHPRYLIIRDIAQRVCDETGADLKPTIETLCWPALKYASNPDSDSELKSNPSNPNIDLLCAAAYLNLIPLAKRLMQEGHSPRDQSCLFTSSSFLLAAWAGNSEMLEIFQKTLPDSLETHLNEINGSEWGGLMELKLPIEDPSHWAMRVNPEAIIGAAMCGDLSMVCRAIYPPSCDSRESPLDGQTSGYLDVFETFSYADLHLSIIRDLLDEAQYASWNVEVYKYLQSFQDREESRDNLTQCLVMHAGCGNLEMVRYFLDAGADLSGFVWHQDFQFPLGVACQYGREDIVDLLLERGANLNYNYGTWPYIESALSIAAKAGNFAIVRKLVEGGCTTGWVSAFSSAVFIEHTAMVKYLLYLGRKRGIFTNGDGEWALETSKNLGLESMVELLQNLGITLQEDRWLG